GGEGYVAEKAESNTGWLFPVGDEAHELGYPHMFTDMFTAIEENRPPLETFYDGYVVNAILDAAYKSAESKLWEPVILEDWRGDGPIEQQKSWNSYDEDHYIIKTEVLPNGDNKVILKHKKTGVVTQKVTQANK
ncbi:MAG TPA: oxidoreductase, partial [Arenibacter sp.]|nr:oxidoreductase [Arenibacter sp.]